MRLSGKSKDDQNEVTSSIACDQSSLVELGSVGEELVTVKKQLNT